MNTPNFIKSFTNHKHFRVYSDPVRDWLITLVFSALVFVGVVIWNVWVFDTVVRGGTIGTIGTFATSTTTTFNHSSLNVVYTIFEKRAIEEAKYATGVYRYADPSQ